MQGLAKQQIHLLGWEHTFYWIQECHVHSLWPRSQLPNPPCPSFSLAPLSPGNAPLLAAAWKFTDEEAISMIEQQTKLGRVLGLFPPNQN